MRLAQRICLAVLAASLPVLPAAAADNVPVPAHCTPDVNQKLGQLLTAKEKKPVDNVMVCGVTTKASKTQKGGPNGDHQVLSVRAVFPDGSNKLIEVVTNDSLDGKVTAKSGAAVSAFGQAFFDNTGAFAAGVHDVHCSTHSGADNGWVVVNGAKHPTSCK